MNLATRIFGISVLILGIFACQGPISLENSNSPDLKTFTLDSRSALPNTANVILEFARIAYKPKGDGTFLAKIYGVADLKNLAYQKTLTLHYGLSNTPDAPQRTWTDASGTYLSTESNGLERWYFETSETSFNDVYDAQFALKYVVSGQTYWDNNANANYKLRVGLGDGRVYDGAHGVLNNGPVVLDKLPGTFSGSNVNWTFQILVKNLAYQKAAHVVYTTNGWATSQSLNAAYSQSQGNSTELWTAALSLPSTAQLQFALSFDVNGQTYWDNNFGKNYSANAQTGLQ